VHESTAWSSVLDTVIPFLDEVFTSSWKIWLISANHVRGYYWRVTKEDGARRPLFLCTDSGPREDPDAPCNERRGPGRGGNLPSTKQTTCFSARWRQPPNWRISGFRPVPCCTIVQFSEMAEPVVPDGSDVTVFGAVVTFFCAQSGRPVPIESRVARGPLAPPPANAGGCPGT